MPSKKIKYDLSQIFYEYVIRVKKYRDIFHEAYKVNTKMLLIYRPANICSVTAKGRTESSSKEHKI